MSQLDYNALRQYAQENVPGLLFVTVSGAHLYGFPSPDSDVDLRGSFAAPLEQVLGLDKVRETAEPEGIVGGVEVEMVGHEIEKYLRLLVKPNGYVLEQILSPLVVLTSPAHEELKALARGGPEQEAVPPLRRLRTGRVAGLSEARRGQNGEASAVPASSLNDRHRPDDRGRGRSERLQV